MSIADTDLKVTSSNSCRKVEFQSGNIDKPITSKGSSHDLRLTLSKNRTKQPTIDETDHNTNGNQLSNDVIESKPISSKIHSTKTTTNNKGRPLLKKILFTHKRRCVNEIKF